MTDQPGCPCSICDEDHTNRSDSRDSAGQSADLRTRIATVIANHRLLNARCEECGERADYESNHQADVLIREIGLEPERRVGPGEPGEGLSGFIRYVTGWEADD